MWGPQLSASLREGRQPDGQDRSGGSVSAGLGGGGQRGQEGLFPRGSEGLKMPSPPTTTSHAGLRQPGGGRGCHLQLGRDVPAEATSSQGFSDGLQT